MLTQHLQPQKEECKDKDGECKCFFPEWKESDWLPQDTKDKDGFKTVEKWADFLIEAEVLRPTGTWRVWGRVKAKFRERHGTCRRTVLRLKVSYVPELGVDLNDDMLASLSDESLALLRERFA